MSDVAIGIDVGGTKALALIVARDGRVLGELQCATPHDEGDVAGSATARVLTTQVRELADGHGLKVTDVPIGIGLPGLMRRDGRLAYAPNLQSASGADIGAQLSAALGSTLVFSENDANCAGLCEHEWGAARGIDDFVMVTLGTGIGGAVFADGRLVRGRSGFAGEIGHMVVVAKGEPCKCGGFGCWERYASGGGLARITTEAANAGRLPALVGRLGGPDAVRPEDVTAAARDGLVEAETLVREMGWWLALGLSNLVAILDCGHFVIGGGLSRASDLVLPYARECLVDQVEGYDARPTITVSESMFGPRSGAMGAALTAFHRTS
ncbi:MAG TPA: ROK family protein [Acidimicrobiales bacterium]|nr:ROK family protein [Acidimicrobiales bacterium]